MWRRGRGGVIITSQKPRDHVYLDKQTWFLTFQPRLILLFTGLTQINPFLNCLWKYQFYGSYPLSSRGENRPETIRTQFTDYVEGCEGIASWQPTQATTEASGQCLLISLWNHCTGNWKFNHSVFLPSCRLMSACLMPISRENMSTTHAELDRPCDVLNDYNIIKNLCLMYLQRILFSNKLSGLPNHMLM